ncbi:hypothetical protein [Candidatus Harpocratesius sp.]
MKTNYSILRSRLVKLEQDLDLFNLEINGVKLWQYLRYSTFIKIGLKLGIDEESHHTETRKIRYLKVLLRDFKNIFTKKSALFQRKKKVELLVFNHPRRKLIDGEYWAIYTDFLIDNSNFNYQIIEVPSFTHGWKIPKNKSTRYLDYWVFALRFLQAKLNPFILTKIDRQKLQNINALFKKEFGVDLNISKEMVKILCKRKAYRFIFKQILSKLHPKAVIEVVGYTIQNMVLNELCKEKNIPTIEFQHGIINSYQLAYNFPKNIEINIFPSYFLSFGKFWIEATSLPIPDSHIFSVGFPYFESQFKKFPFNNKKPEKILFISQGSIGKELSSLAVEFSHLTSKKVIFKLHPGEYLKWKKEPYFSSNENIEVIDNDKIPLYQLFCESFAVVGVYSTAVYEALMFKNYIFIYDLPSHVKLGDLINKGYAELVKSAQDLHERVEILSNKPFPHQIDLNKFFRSNSLENQIMAIKKILSNY